MGHHSTARDLAMIAAYGMKYQMFRDKVANDYYKVPYQNRAPETIRTTNHFIRNKWLNSPSRMFPKRKVAVFGSQVGIDKAIFVLFIYNNYE